MAVVVVGSLNMDLVATASRLPRPGETLQGHGFSRHAGGKGGNQAAASAKLGATTRLLAKVGADAFGAELRALLDAQGVDTALIFESELAATGTALITVDDAGENTIVVVPGANAELTPRDAARLEIARGDIVLAQLEVPPVTVERVFQRARDAGVTTVLNPSPVAPCTPSLLEASDVLVLNEVELAQLTGRALAAEAVTPDAVRALARRHGQLVVVTLGARGALAVRAEEQSVVAGRPVPVVDTTGAGDTFAGALAALLDSRLPLAVCLEGANVAASLSVQRAGAAASSPTRAELEATWQRQW